MKVEDVPPIGKRKTFAHLNYGEFDKRNGFQEVMLDEYPPELVEAGRLLRSARVGTDLGLRDAAKLLGVSASLLSGLESGSKRFTDAADRDRLLALYAARAPSIIEKQTPTSEDKTNE